MRELAILIPSYKRPEVLEATLKGLLDTIQEATTGVSIYLGLNSPDERVLKVAEDYKELFSSKGISYYYISSQRNIGKAEMLNMLFEGYCLGKELIITMDNDMVLKKPWLAMIEVAQDLDFEMMGFASSTFWVHLPSKDKCKAEPVGDYNLYNVPDIGGGMLLFKRDILEKHKWTNLGGVYGRDDEQMCRKLSKKVVFEWPVDWLDHDPLSISTPVLEMYTRKKKDLYKRGITVFSEGWDE